MASAYVMCKKAKSITKPLLLYPAELDQQVKRLRVQWETLRDRHADLRTSEFDWKTCLENARNAELRMKAKEWQLLRVVYKKLFESIIVDAQQDDGTRRVQFHLRENQESGSLLQEGVGGPLSGSCRLEDVFSTRVKMVELPLTSRP